MAGILPPNGILFGFNTIKKVGEQAKKLGATQTLLVTDETMVQLGYAGLVQESLEKAAINVDTFGRVEAEPHLETADLLFDMTLKKKYNLVIGLGGGSSMDMGKLTSILATNPQPPLELMSKKVVNIPALKKILIPTTSGTGSEVSHWMVASSHKEKYAMATPFAFAEIAIIDPGLTISVPPKITASTGMDALTHAVESLTNKLANPMSDYTGLGSVELISKYLRRATFNPQDLEARYYMSISATLAMMSMGGHGALYAHSIANALAMYQPIAHGVGCAVGLPYTMAFNVPVIEERMALIARAMGEKIDSLSTRAAAWRAVEMVYDLMADIKMPMSLKEMGFRHQDLDKMVEFCLTKFPRPNNPRPMSKEEALLLFEAMYEGKLNRL